MARYGHKMIHHMPIGDTLIFDFHKYIVLLENLTHQYLWSLFVSVKTTQKKVGCKKETESFVPKFDE